MYQLLNCLPISQTKLIRRIKIIKKRSHRRRSVSASLPSPNARNKLQSALSTSSISNNPLIEPNKYSEVQLVRYSNLDVDEYELVESTTVAELSTAESPKSTAIQSSSVEATVFESVEVTVVESAKSTAIQSSSVEATVFESVEVTVVESAKELRPTNDVRVSEAFEACEDDRTGVFSGLVMQEEHKSVINSTMSDEELNDKILHELHLHSQPVQTSRTATSNSNRDDSCTLAKHPDADDHRTPLNVCRPQATFESNDVTATDRPMGENTALRAVESSNHPNLTDRQLIDNSTPDEPADTELILTATRIDQQKDLTNQLNKLASARLTQTSEPAAKPTVNQTNAAVSAKHAGGQVHDSHLDDKRKTKKLLQDPDLRITTILNGTETWIELNKGNDCALGIDLIDRTINDERVFIIHEIIEKGIAETDQRLLVGDVILQVNDIPLKEMTCEEAIEHLNRTSGSVKLLVYRELICVKDDDQSNKSNKPNSSIKVNYSTKSTMQENGVENGEQRVINGKLYQIVQVELQKKSNNKGLGLCIVSDNGQSPGAYISEILPNSVASMEGSLKKGDHIVSVNGEDVTSASIHNTLAMLKCLQGLISLKVARLMPGKVVSLESFNRNQFVE